MLSVYVCKCCVDCCACVNNSMHNLRHVCTGRLEIHECNIFNSCNGIKISYL